MNGHLLRRAVVSEAVKKMRGLSKVLAMTPNVIKFQELLQFPLLQNWIDILLELACT